MAEFVPKTKMGPPVIRAMNSNTLSDTYRDAITIAYQYIGSEVPNSNFDFCGKCLPAPIMAGPVEYEAGGKTASDPVEYARGIRDAGSIYWATFHNNDAWQKVLAEGIPAIREIKPLADLDRVLEEIRLDTERGALGYAMDIDHGLTAYGELDSQQERFAPKTTEDLRRLSNASPLPFFLKGVLSIHDALAAVEAGVTGIVISGHNNRFPCAVPPLRVLPEIRRAVGNRLVILVDGGLNTGYDVFKALALGADGTLCARALAAAFTKGGREGVTYKLLEMSAELRGAMANTGSPDLGHINRASVILP